MAQSKLKTPFEALSQAEAAFLIGVSPRWLRDHPEVAQPARGADGKYDPVKLVQAIRQLDCGRSKRVDPRNSPNLERYRKARAELAELEVAKASGEFLPVEAIRQYHNKAADLMYRFRERFERLLDGSHKDRFSETWDCMWDDVDRLSNELFGPQQQEPIPNEQSEATDE